jgi:hypothetical protein
LKNTSGRRIIAFISLIEGIQEITTHSLECFRSSIELYCERRCGLLSELVFKCKCGWVVKICSNSPCNSLPINDSFAWGCEISPVGFTAASSLLTAMDIPVPDFKTFQKYENKCKISMENSFVSEMKEAMENEKKLAIAADEFVVVEGVKYASATVCVDCGWSKRSYGHSYSANCGVAVIIGTRTKKIIYADTRCTTCAVCDKIAHEAEVNIDRVKSKHVCMKNWKGPATAMETDIIKEGFKQSRKHGVVFTKFIGDGDSSVHASVENIYPGIKVKKIECKNHLYKN